MYKSSNFFNLINTEKVIINDIKYRNIKNLYSKLPNTPNIINLNQQKKLIIIHLELHFYNILI